jgi:hypothetical protein
MVTSSLYNNNWIRDLNGCTGFTTEHLLQVTALWALVAQTPLTPQQEDRIYWTQTKHGEYTTASAYKAWFTYSPRPRAGPLLSSIWKTWAPPKCKFFAWLILQNRI